RAVGGDADRSGGGGALDQDTAVTGELGTVLVVAGGAARVDEVDETLDGLGGGGGEGRGGGGAVVDGGDGGGGGTQSGEQRRTDQVGSRAGEDRGRGRACQRLVERALDALEQVGEVGDAGIGGIERP